MEARRVAHRWVEAEEGAHERGTHACVARAVGKSGMARLGMPVGARALPNGANRHEREHSGSGERDARALFTHTRVTSCRLAGGGVHSTAVEGVAVS